ncbi:MAG TPA: MlaD family protein [Rhizomicrobium sp.]|jgi:phospholipid/cholesterol/gamma-HCH transport system substrate-binding protein|nr:MlaD family protein [Rhizomicrobium sp.]
METKANYVAVGAFVLICVIGLVVSIMWLAGAQYAQEYSYYQAYFKGPVTGIGKGTVTRYNGIDVGHITDLQFNPNDPQSVIVTLQVQPHLNIREDSVASIESQGFTGATYVEISGGTAKSALLTAKPGEKYPVIRTKQSGLLQLEQSAPEVVAKLNVAASQINDLLNDNNRKAITQILSNLDETTAVIARRSDDIDAILRNANQATANLNKAAANFQPTLDHVDLTVTKFGKVADDADAFLKGDALAQLSNLVNDLRRLTGNLNKFSDQLNREPTTLLFGDRRKGYQPNGK